MVIYCQKNRANSRNLSGIIIWNSPIHKVMKCQNRNLKKAIRLVFADVVMNAVFIFIACHKLLFCFAK